MGYDIFADGTIAPLNQMNAPGRALLALHDLTGTAVYRTRATKLAAFLKSKLTHVTNGDYYLWAYYAKPPTAPPGRGEDVSHAAINAHFMYEAWTRGIVFDDLDMARLTRTFTKGVYLGKGAFAGALGSRSADTTYTPQLYRWTFLARFDPAVESSFLAYAAVHPDSISALVGAGAYGYLKRARAMRDSDQKRE